MTVVNLKVHIFSVSQIRVIFLKLNFMLKTKRVKKKDNCSFLSQTLQLMYFRQKTVPAAFT